MKQLAVTLLALTGGLAAVGCGGDSTSPDDRGTFQATVTGDLSLSLSGEAVFGSASGGPPAFTITFIRGDPATTDSDIIAIGRDNPTAPGSGTFAIEAGDCDTCTSDDFAALYVLSRSNGDLARFISESGSFTITSATTSRLEGTFTFTAVVVPPSLGNVTAENITIQGSFTAVAGSVPFLQ